MTGAELAERRRVLGLTQTQLAALLGVPQGTLSNWERGSKVIGNPTLVERALRDIEREYTATPIGH